MCPKCGSDMEEDPDEGVLECPDCGYEEDEDDGLAAGPADPSAGARTQRSVCARGHALVRDVLNDREHDGRCPICGADVIAECQWCGLDFDTGVESAEARLRCPRCERPFPWNAEARRARWLRFPNVLYVASAVATIVASTLYVSTFLR